MTTSSLITSLPTTSSSNITMSLRRSITSSTILRCWSIWSFQNGLHQGREVGVKYPALAVRKLEFSASSVGWGITLGRLGSLGCLWSRFYLRHSPILVVTASQWWQTIMCFESLYSSFTQIIRFAQTIMSWKPHTSEILNISSTYSVNSLPVVKELIIPAWAKSVFPWPSKPFTRQFPLMTAYSFWAFFSVDRPVPTDEQSIEGKQDDWCRYRNQKWWKRHPRPWGASPQMSLCHNFRIELRCLLCAGFNQMSLDRENEHRRCWA